jgi:hypothetical protein
MLLELAQALGFGLDVFRAIGLSFWKQLELAIQDAGGGEVDHLLQIRWIGEAEQLFDSINIHRLSPGGIPPGRGGVDDPGGRGDGLCVGAKLAQVTDQQGDPGILW